MATDTGKMMITRLPNTVLASLASFLTLNEARSMRLTGRDGCKLVKRIPWGIEQKSLSWMDSKQKSLFWMDPDWVRQCAPNTVEVWMSSRWTEQDVRDFILLPPCRIWEVRRLYIHQDVIYMLMIYANDFLNDLYERDLEIVMEPTHIFYGYRELERQRQLDRMEQEAYQNQEWDDATWHEMEHEEYEFRWRDDEDDV